MAKNEDKFSLLRKTAKELMQSGKQDEAPKLSETGILKLIQELEIHQVELELQNQELIRSRKEQQEAIDKYSELYDFAPIGYFSLNRQGVIERLNLCGANLLGSDRSRLKDKLFWNFLDDKSKNTFYVFLQEVFKSTGKESCEISLLKGGTELVFSQLTGIVSENKEICFLTAIDITERKKVESALIDNEKRYRIMLDILDAGIVLHAADTSILTANEKAVELLGLTHDQILGKRAIDPHWEFIREDATALPLYEYPVNQIINSQQKLLNYTLGVHSGSAAGVVWLVVNGLPVFNEEGILTEVLISFIDITERKNAEEALLRSEEKYRTIFENVQDVFYQTDLEGIIREISPSIRYFSEFSREEMLNRQVSDIYYESADRLDFLRTLSEKGEVRDYELRLKAGTGEIRYVSINARLILNESGDPDHIDGAFRDVTERRLAKDALKETHEKLVRAQRVAKIGSWENSLVTGHLNWSEQMYHLMGFSPGDPVNFAKAAKVFSPSDLHRLEDALAKAMNENAPYSMNFKIILADGTERYIHDEGELIRDESGKAILMYGTTQDISEQMKAEESLLEKMDELIRFKRLTVGRELAMIELKKEVNELLKLAGEPEKYSIAE